MIIFHTDEKRRVVCKRVAINNINEEEQYLDKLENQTINGNNITAELEHFSSYIVLIQKNLMRYGILK